jgi:RNA polymerase sigma-70 factor (ECF subfamily)
MDNPRNNNVREKTKYFAEAEIPNQSTLTRLIDKAISGDYEAYGEIYSIFLNRIYRYVYYQISNEMIAEDITQEVFIKAWNAIGTCKGKERTFSAWLYRIAHNKTVDVLRRRGKEKSIEMELIVDDRQPAVEVQKEMNHSELLDGIAELPGNQKQVIVLKFIEGLDNDEIGRIMGKKQGAIRILQMRALNKLRDRLSPEF